MIELSKCVEYRLIDTSFYVKVDSFDKFDLGVYINNQPTLLSSVNDKSIGLMIPYLRALTFTAEGEYCIEPDYKVPMYFSYRGGRLSSVAYYMNAWTDVKEISLDTIKEMPGFLENVLLFAGGLKPSPKIARLEFPSIPVEPVKKTSNEEMDELIGKVNLPSFLTDSKPKSEVNNVNRIPFTQLPQAPAEVYVKQPAPSSSKFTQLPQAPSKVNGAPIDNPLNLPPDLLALQQEMLGEINRLKKQMNK